MSQKGRQERRQALLHSSMHQSLGILAQDAEVEECPLVGQGGEDELQHLVVLVVLRTHKQVSTGMCGADSQHGFELLADDSATHVQASPLQQRVVLLSVQYGRQLMRRF